jgi:gluconolactonase
MEKITRRTAIAGLALLPLAAHAQTRPATGVRRIDPALDAIVARDARIELLGTGYTWAEGPVWVPKGDYLLFGDVPNNVAYRYKRGEGVTPFLQPSGLAGTVPPEFHEAGSNGLAIDAGGHLVMADSGTRAIARVDLATKRKTILVDRYEGKKFNSPNDLTIARDGTIYFTDPPYGLKKNEQSPIRELDFNGLYRLGTDGKLTLLDRSYRRPNGVALSPDGRTLYLALSDETRSELLALPLDARGMPSGAARLFHDMKPWHEQGLPGLPDGVKVMKSGHVFATGPGGVHVLSPTGKLLGIISTGKSIANCAFGEDGKTLFMTSHDMLAAVRLNRSAW